MTLRCPEALNSGHKIGFFDCGKPTLNDWLIRHALQAQSGGSARTFVATDEDKVVGYHSLTVGQIDTLEAPERFRKGMGLYPIPVVILARLAVSIPYRGYGIGRGLLQDAVRRSLMIAEQAGIRALLTHPIDADASRFYLRFGFIASPIREQQLLLLLKDARRLFIDSPITRRE
ncbi:MAG: GNAT family N-acetyltransferase [Pseudomonadota bacterium]